MASPPTIHRGAEGDAARFADRFIAGRVQGFRKDMRICLTSEPKPDGRGFTCAFFPALGACCSLLEYLTGLYVGRLEGLGRRDVSRYAEAFLPQPAYDAEIVRILVEAFRNRVNHRGIASGVWVDRRPGTGNRRLVWSIKASDASPAIVVEAHAGTIVKDSPWPCVYTHRVTIRLRRLADDVVDSAGRFTAALHEDAKLRERFMACMREMYPTGGSVGGNAAASAAESAET